MPLGSLVLLGLLIYIFLIKKYKYSGLDELHVQRYADLFVLCCVVKIFWFQGYFLKIGSSEISSLGNLVDDVLFVYSLYLLLVNKIKLEKNTIKAVVIFVSVICIGMLYEMISPYSGLLMPEQNEQMSWDTYISGKSSMYQYEPPLTAFFRPLLVIFIFSFNILIFKQIVYDRWILECYMRVIGYLKYGIFYGYFEFFLKNIAGNLTLTYDVSAALLGVNAESINTEASIRGSAFYALQGLSREPSHFNVFLFTVAILMILGNLLKRIADERNWKYPHTYTSKCLVLCIILMLMTGGFSSVWFLFIIGCVFLILRIRESGNSITGFIFRRKKVVLSSIFIFIGIIYAIMQNNYLYDRLMDAVAVVGFLSDSNSFYGIGAIVENDGGSSTIARFVSIYEGTMIFLERPFWGLSYGMQSLHDFTMQYLANIGIIGVYTLYKMLSVSKDNLRYDYSILILIFMIGGLPITISPNGLGLYWLLYFEATTFYMNDWGIKNVPT